MDDVKKLTPEETVEAIRHCVNDLHCTECVMRPHLSTGECTMKLLTAAADTIEELLAQKLPALIVPDGALSEETLAKIRESMKDCHIMASGEEPSIEFVPQVWVPVTERLPTNKRNFDEYIVSMSRCYFPTSSYDPVDAPYSEEYTTIACFDHEQKTWHLCRSEVVLNALIMPEDAPLNGECVTAWAEMPTPYR